MKKSSSQLRLAALALMAVAVPTFVQTAAARPARHRLIDPPRHRLYNFAPGGLYDYAPGPVIVSPFSNHPAATGGGSFGYNLGVLRDN